MPRVFAYQIRKFWKIFEKKIEIFLSWYFNPALTTITTTTTTTITTNSASAANTTSDSNSTTATPTTCSIAI